MVLGIILIRWNALSMPYFWDELGVYILSSMHLADNGLSLLPSAVPVEFSRGHPLMCPFLFGSWMSVFGTSVLSAHSAALVFSILLLWATYILGKDLFNRSAGILAAGFLMMQALFLAQATLVLPEVLLALFITLSLVFYFRRSMLLYALFGSMAVLTKETAIVLPLVLIVLELIFFLFDKHKPFVADVLKRSFIWAIPLLVFAAFLGIQKVQNGWFLYPYHTSLMSADFGEILARLLAVLKFLFLEQGRMFFLPFVLFGLFNAFGNSERRKMLVLLSVIGAFVLFSSLNFFMERYLLLLLPIAMILTAYGLINIPKLGKQLFVVALLVIPVFFWHPNSFSYDYNLSFEEQLSVQKQASEYLEENSLNDENIAANFPLIVGLRDPRLGFVKSDFSNSRAKYFENAEYCVISKPGADMKNFKKEKYEKIKSFSNEISEVTIYKLKDK